MEKSDEKLLNDMMTINAFFCEDDDARMLEKLKALGEMDPNNIARLRQLTNDMVGVIIRAEMDEYALRPHYGNAGHWRAFFDSAGSNEAEWEKRLEALSATGEDIAEKIGDITEAIIEVWHRDSLAAVRNE